MRAFAAAGEEEESSCSRPVALHSLAVRGLTRRGDWRPEHLMLVPLQLKLHLHQRSISLHPHPPSSSVSPAGRCFSNHRLLFPISTLFSSRRPLPVQRISWDASCLRSYPSAGDQHGSTTTKYIEVGSKSSASSLKLPGYSSPLLPAFVCPRQPSLQSPMPTSS